MTLVLTEVSARGVIQVADSAITESDGRQTRVLYNARKLFTHERCHSLFGTSGAEFVVGPRGLVAVEFLLLDYLGKHKREENIELLAKRLRDLLNGVRAERVTRIDIAACSLDEKGEFLPQVLRIDNGSPEDESHLTEFTLRAVRQRGSFDPDRDANLIVSGDTNIGLWVRRFREAFDEVADSSDLRVFEHTFLDRARHLVALARCVAELYINPQGIRSVGGAISATVLEYQSRQITLIGGPFSSEPSLGAPPL
jgi:hypothetical protein